MQPKVHAAEIYPRYVLPAGILAVSLAYFPTLPDPFHSGRWFLVCLLAAAGLFLQCPPFGNAPGWLRIPASANVPLLFAVGFVGDQYAVAPKTILTSAIENIHIGMLEVAKLAQAGKLQGKSYVIGVENEQAAGYGKFGDEVPQKVKDKVAEAKKLMLEGKLKQK